MNLYEIVKPVRKENRYDGDNWIERWANFSPKGFLTTVFMGYSVLLGSTVGWCLATGI
jgi:hypothetical protein